ncbi:MAG: branched-chain amino acid ABC transporter permease [Alphaproteobacteria bacterium]|nr:branched-chain amino acid ABC transporter permease [Alphaproteobacteria bacterium]
MDVAAITIIQIINMISMLALMSIGLAVIFGMMRVINLAHGEFLMLGTYAVLVPAKLGVNIWISMFIIAPIFVGLVGVLVERIIVRRLYGRMMDTLLATWGLSLLIIGIMTTIFGNTMEGVSTPFGNFSIGEIAESQYKFFIIGIAAALMAAVFVVLKYTKLGLIARGTMQNANMASALGISPSTVYTATFGIGAALTGFAGAVLAPVIGAAPTLGVAYVAKAFITVIGGGQAILTGTASASGVFGVINQVVTYFSTPVLGEVALLIGAVLLLRVLPQGITGRFFRRGL